MATKKKSWQQKLHDSKDLPKIGALDSKGANKWGGRTMVIPAPLEVDALMKNVARGKLTTINEIRVALAKKHGVDIACPLTSGILAWIAAYAAEEIRGQGDEGITPYWRTLKSGGELNPKYPGGIEQQKTFLENEGHSVVQKGKKYVVENFESKLEDL